MKKLQSGISTMTPPYQHPCNTRGFTLVELMIAMAVGGLVLTAVMTSFMSQRRSYIAQDDVIEMQQNGRVAMDMLTRDIRSAGYDPNGLNAGITTAGANNLVFTREDDSNPNTLETISYSLFDAFTTDGSNDGFVDDLALQIFASGGGTAGRQAVAENFGRLEFRYLDEDGEITSTLDDIRSILVILLAVSSKVDQNFNNTRAYSYTYTSPAGNPTIIGWAADNDNFRKRLFVTAVNCRNLDI